MRMMAARVDRPLKSSVELSPTFGKLRSPVHFLAESDKFITKNQNTLQTETVLREMSYSYVNGS
jgi:hypothetical protein